MITIKASQVRYGEKFWYSGQEYIRLKPSWQDSFESKWGQKMKVFAVNNDTIYTFFPETTCTVERDATFGDLPVGTEFEFSCKIFKKIDDYNATYLVNFNKDTPVRTLEWTT